MDVLAEIKEEFQNKAKSQQGPSSPTLTLGNTSGRVLFIVKDSLALAQLRDVLVSGIASVCDQRFRWFVSQQAAEIRNRVYKQHQQQSRGRWSANKRAADSAAAGGAHKQTRGDAASSVDNQSLFLYPTDSDLLGVPKGNVSEVLCF